MFDGELSVRNNVPVDFNASAIKLCHVDKNDRVHLRTNAYFWSRKSSIEELKIFCKQP